MRNTFRKPCKTGASFALSLVRNSAWPRCRVALITGSEKYSGAPLAMLYIGAGRNHEFLVNRLFASARLAWRQDRIHPLAALSRYWRAAADADLMVVDLDLPYSLLCSSRACLRVPQWVKQKLFLPSTREAFVEGLPRKLRREVHRCIRKYGYFFDVVDSEDAFRAFYHEFYVPFIKNRFDRESVLVDEASFLAECRLGALLRLLRDGRPVAAAVLQQVGRQLSSVWVGYSDAAEAARGTGASDVLDYFTIEHAYELGCQVIDFGPSRPLLDDGVFRYKRKWGTGVQGAKFPAGNILLRPLRSSLALRSIMTNNFWITRDRGRFVGQLMVQGQSMGTETLKNIAKNCGLGINSLELKSLSGFDAAIHEAAEDMPGIRLIDLSGSDEPALDPAGR